MCGWKLCARRTKLGQCDLQPLHTERVLATGRRTLAIAQRHRIALHAPRTHGRGQQAHHAGGAAGPLFRQDLVDNSVNSSQTISASHQASGALAEPCAVRFRKAAFSRGEARGGRRRDTAAPARAPVTSLCTQ